MANIALRTNTQLDWDEENRNFWGNEKANALLKPVYRKPWKFPGS